RPRRRASTRAVTSQAETHLGAHSPSPPLTRDDPVTIIPICLAETDRLKADGRATTAHGVVGSRRPRHRPGLAVPTPQEGACGWASAPRSPDSRCDRRLT